MCEFVSWVKKDRKVYFLTGKQVFQTPKGEVLQKWCGSRDDLIGHGAIRWFYDLEKRDGTNEECRDFSSPKNFPTVITRAIKRGDMRGLACPAGLLSASAWKAYQEATAPAGKAYQEATAPAGKAYQEAKAPAEKAYQEATASAWKAYQEAKAPAEKAYQEAMASAEKAYQEATAPAGKAYQEAMASAWKAYQEAKAYAYWDLFANPANRAEAWK